MNFTEKLNAIDAGNSAVAKAGSMIEGAEAHGTYTAELYDAQGNLKWSDVIENVVTTVGKNLALDTVFAGSSYTAAVVMGLKNTGTAIAADTQASHASWTECGGTNAPAYSGTRKTPAFSSASAGSKATSSAASFTFTSGGTVAGCFINLAGSSTIDNTSGTLYSAGDFTGGSKTVASTDVLNVTWTASL